MTMTDSPSTQLAESIRARFAEQVTSIALANGETTIEVEAANWIAVASALRDEPTFAFAQLMDLAAVDYFGYGQDDWTTQTATFTGFSRGVQGQEGAGRFDWVQRPAVEMETRRYAVAVQLLSIKHNRRLRLRCRCEDNALPRLPSLIEIWRGVDWFEREAFDLYGIIFEGHPDLRRILTDYGFVGHPFRKDFPLIGNVEVRYDPVAKRVLYEPVTSVVPRVTVARVIRDDVDLAQGKAEIADHWRDN